MSAVLTHPEMTPQRLDCLADDAVGFEPVSKLKFPNNREKYRENPKIKPEMTTASSLNAASIGVFGETPCGK